MIDHTTRVTRRRLLLGGVGVAGAALLAACGGGTATVAPTARPATGASTAPSTAPAAAPSSAASSVPAAPAASAAPSAAAAASATPAASSAAAIPSSAPLPAATVRIALFGSQEAADAAKKLFAIAKQQQPNISVDVTPYQAPDWSGFFEKLLTQVAAGQTPDMASVATEGAHLFAGRKLAISLDEYIKRDKEQLREYFKDVSPALVEAMMYEGKLYSLPDNFNAANLYYSKTAFDKKGVKYPIDWTKDQFAEAAPKLATISGGRTTEYAYFWTNRMWGGALPWMFINGGNILTEEKAPGGEQIWGEFYKDVAQAQGRGGGYRWNKATANAPANVEALQFLSDLTNKQKVAPSPAEAESSNATINTTFANGQLAMFASGGFLVRGLTVAGVKPESYSATFMPKWKGQRHQFGTAGFWIFEASKNKDAAWELAKFRISKEAMTAQFPNGSSVPARRSLAQPLYEGTYGFKDYAVFYDTLDKYPDTAPIPQPPSANQVTAIFTKYIGLAMTEDLTPQAALDQMQKELTDVLAKPIQ